MVFLAKSLFSVKSSGYDLTWSGAKLNHVSMMTWSRVKWNFDEVLTEIKTYSNGDFLSKRLGLGKAVELSSAEGVRVQ